MIWYLEKKSLKNGGIGLVKAAERIVDLSFINIWGE